MNCQLHFHNYINDIQYGLSYSYLGWSYIPLICYKPVPMSYRYTIIDVEEFNRAEESFKS